MEPDKFSGIEKAEPEAADLAGILRVHLVKFLENFGSSSTDADATILDNYLACLFIFPERYRYSAGTGREFEGIVNHLLDSKADLFPVKEEAWQRFQIKAISTPVLPAASLEAWSWSSIMLFRLQGSSLSLPLGPLPG